MRCSLYILLLPLLLVACGGGSEDTKVTPESVIITPEPTPAPTPDPIPDPTPPDEAEVFLEVKVIDGYLSQAITWLDINENLILDSTEPYSESQQGIVRLNVTSIEQPESYPLVAKAIAGKTIDQDLGLDGAVISDDFILLAPAGFNVLTPLTTAVSLNMLNDDDQDIAQTKVANALAIDSTKLGSDFIAENNLEVKTNCKIYNSLKTRTREC